MARKERRRICLFSIKVYNYALAEIASSASCLVSHFPDFAED